MIGVIISFAVALVLSMGLTPVFIRFQVNHHIGQFVRQDGPTQHLTKRGTPIMGGVVFIVASVIAWLVGYLAIGSVPDWSSTLLVFLFVGLGVIGLLDDVLKVRHEQSLGLHAGAKFAGQLLVGSLFAWGALVFPDRHGITPGSMAISVFRPTGVTLAFAGVGVGVVLFLLWSNFLVAAWSNAVNLTDGLDGLATGCSIFVFGAYTMITVFQNVQSCWGSTVNLEACYPTRDPLGLAILSAGIVGSLAGFLWWNASPAQIFMGDTGSLALGGALAGLSILTNTEFIAVVIGGMFVVITMSDVIQIGVFKATHKRVFRMAPLHHHFELKGWEEITIVVRFWLIAALFAITGVGLFYAEWASHL
ncbi:phospho-N-acetylmuramoyl-pentapeptide-transferase [Actinomyces polynesiensis]|uniref:phospho-N-acetylmuramoyl-pentapeptide- transferase n=1 Tax=Actinomyces polynesiensis TaxID=1325934 RepID=UPI0005B84EDF|nr:phospho-N-acetylmuramoyl-pentapeptide-transferase [Actinomyces polynesiensis]